LGEPSGSPFLATAGLPTLGNWGKLMTKDFREGGERLKEFDTDQSFMLVEIAGDKLYFQTIARSGATIDSGDLPRTAIAKTTK
jgi:hypothetical protein